jgi:type I restriction enzyme M protein
MSTADSQQFLRDLDKKLWTAADKLRANLDAAVYKHAVLGLIFLKYVSDSFADRQKEIEAQLRALKSDYFLDPADFKSNPTTWRLAAMNMAIRGIDFNFGKEPANSFTSDQHPDLRADYVMANPPFNISEWWDAKLEGDPRWRYGTPPKGNANFAWIQHMLHHLAPQGSMALLLANGSRAPRPALHQYSDSRLHLVPDERQIRNQTLTPALSQWEREERSGGKGEQFRDRRGETLFIDARKLGYMIDRVLRAFTTEDLEKITGTFQKWKRSAADYADLPGFCKSATLEEIAAHGFVLTPGRYVGTEDVEDDGEPFEEKMARLVDELGGQFTESQRLEAEIRQNLSGLGFAP